MSALEREHRSIGRVLYEARFPLTTYAWASLGDADRERYERAAEVIFNRGFEAGREHQKTALPPPKARALGMQLVKERLAWAEKKRAARDALEQVKAALGDRLLANGPLSMPYAHGVMRQLDAALTALRDEP